jgi:hypothetical protein
MPDPFSDLFPDPFQTFLDPVQEMLLSDEFQAGWERTNPHYNLLENAQLFGQGFARERGIDLGVFGELNPRGDLFENLFRAGSYFQESGQLPDWLGEAADRGANVMQGFADLPQAAGEVLKGWEQAAEGALAQFTESATTWTDLGDRLTGLELDLGGAEMDIGLGDEILPQSDAAIMDAASGMEPNVTMTGADVVADDSADLAMQAAGEMSMSVGAETVAEAGADMAVAEAGVDVAAAGEVAAGAAAEAGFAEMLALLFL